MHEPLIAPTSPRRVANARCSAAAIVTLIIALLGDAFAADVVVYDEALQNDFLNYSYSSGGGSVVFNSTAQAHGGTHSIAFTAGGYDAVKVANNTTLFDTATTPRMQLWFYGTQAQCQRLDVILERNDGGLGDTFLASGALSAYANNCLAVVAGQWFEVAVDFTAAPISYAGTYDRISLFNRDGAALGPVYFDDITLLATPDDIFKSGFDTGAAPPPACGMTDEHDVTVLSMASDRFDWCDAAGNPRSAVLAHNDGPAGPGGTRGGELRQFTYQVGAATRTVNASGNGASGFGYVVSHPIDESYCTGAKIDALYDDPYDTSLLGHLRGGTFERVFEGRHHAIFRFHANYPRYCSTVNAAPLGYVVPVTIDWVFANGRDDPLWSITWDLSSVPADKLEDDSRAPYGELLFDGSADEGAHSTIAGVAWGDQYAFTTTSSPAKLSSDWSWNQKVDPTYSIPFVKLWTTDVDATMGTVSTQTIDQKDVAGYFDVVKFWNHTSADNLPNCNVPAPTYKMPCIDFWPYQSINFSFGGADVATNSTRLAWGTEYGFLGQSGYHIHGSTYWGGPLDDIPRPGHPLQSYSVYVVLGTHSSGPVDARVAQVVAMQTVTLAINGGIGTVATGGPAGITRADTITYGPPGYDPVYGALTFFAAGNALDANITVGSGTLHHPLLIVRSYTSAAYPSSVKVAGTTLVADVDYLASLRPDSNEMWITLNSDLIGTTRLQITP